MSVGCVWELEVMAQSKGPAAPAISLALVFTIASSFQAYIGRLLNYGQGPLYWWYLVMWSLNRRECPGGSFPSLGRLLNYSYRAGAWYLVMWSLNRRECPGGPFPSLGRLLNYSYRAGAWYLVMWSLSRECPGGPFPSLCRLLAIGLFIVDKVVIKLAGGRCWESIPRGNWLISFPPSHLMCCRWYGFSPQIICDKVLILEVGYSSCWPWNVYR